MIQVPESLKAEIRKLRGRRLQARCRLDFSDTNIDNTIIGFGGSKNNASVYEQIYNGKKDVSAKWFSLDGSCVLDGSYLLPPVSSSDIEKYEMGWWSGEVSNRLSDFVEDSPSLFGELAFGEEALTAHKNCYPMIAVNFFARQVQEISIAFDNAREEFAVDFTFNLYDCDGALLYTQDVTGNTGFQYTRQITPVLNVCVVEFVIKKWSHPLRNAKVAEMFTMITLLVNAKDIMNIQVIEDRELSDNNLPIGTTAAGSCVVTFYNRDRLFDWDNSLSRLYNYIRKGVKISPEIGDGINWIPLGTFFAEEWDIPRDDISVTVTGLDRMATLEESSYTTSRLIVAPDDQTEVVEGQSQWAAGDMDGTEAVGGVLRLVL
jgi:hypothetical protein